ncbi:SDR family oxidoreductase [bacterium]|nr:SDR family oxidoreductase [bacterium]
MGKLFIIGATGHLGGLALQDLLEIGVPANQIVAVVRDMEKAEPLKAHGVEIRMGDYNDADFSASVFEGADKLLFVSSPSSDNTHRIRQHARVVEAARDAGVGHIVYTGIAFPEQHHSGLEHVHIATEHAIQTTGIPFTFLRNGFYMEYFLAKPELERALEDGKLLSAAEGKKVNFVSRVDLALAAAVVLNSDGHKNKVYELTYPDAYSYEDIANTLSKLFDKSVDYQEASLKEIRAYLQDRGMSEEQIQFDSSGFQPLFASGWASNVTDDLVSLIGRENLTTYEDFIKGLLD